MSREVHRHLAELQCLLGGVGLGAAHHRAQSSAQLAQAERLWNVVVGAAVEPAHPVRFLAARGQHDDRERARLRRATDLAADFDAGNQRQHPIEQHDVGFALGNAHQRLFAVARLGDLETVLFEIVAQQGDERRLVFDDQDERAGHAWVRPGDTISRDELSPFGRFWVNGVPCTRK